MYARRNTITIGIALVLLLAIGIFWYSTENKKAKLLQVKQKKLSQQLDGSLEIAKRLEGVEQEYRMIKDRWDFSSKQIIAAEEPSFSLSYLNWLVNKYNVPLEFDFELKNISTIRDVLSFSFQLRGEGTYNDFYRLIWFLTENPLLYQIETFALKQGRNSNNLVEFTLNIKGFSSTQKLDSGPEFSFDSIRPVAQNFQFYDAFKPVVFSSPAQPQRQTNNIFRREVPKIIPKVIDPGLLNIEEATLQAVANGCAYLKDKKGKLVSLKIGDKVRYGRLQSIDQKKSEVEFLLDQEGSSRKVILGLGYKK
jgi:hypothetical protein